MKARYFYFLIAIHICRVGSADLFSDILKNSNHAQPQTGRSVVDKIWPKKAPPPEEPEPVIDPVACEKYISYVDNNGPYNSPNERAAVIEIFLDLMKLNARKNSNRSRPPYFSDDEALKIALNAANELTKEYPDGIPPNALRRTKEDLIKAHNVWMAESAINYNNGQGLVTVLRVTPDIFRSFVQKALESGRAVTPEVVEYINGSLESAYFNKVMGAINDRPVAGGGTNMRNGKQTGREYSKVHWNREDLKWVTSLKGGIFDQYPRWEGIYKNLRERPWPMYIPTDAQLDQLPNIHRSYGPGTISETKTERDAELGARLSMVNSFESVYIAENVEKLFPEIEKTANDNTDLFEKFSHCDDSPVDYLNCFSGITEDQLNDRILKTERIKRQLLLSRRSYSFERVHEIYAPLIDDQLATLRKMESWRARQDQREIEAPLTLKQNKSADEKPPEEPPPSIFTAPLRSILSVLSPDEVTQKSSSKAGNTYQLVSHTYDGPRDGGPGGTLYGNNDSEPRPNFGPTPSFPHPVPVSDPEKVKREIEATKARLHQQLPGAIQKAQSDASSGIATIQTGMASKLADLRAQAESSSRYSALARDVASHKESPAYQNIAERFPNLPEELKREFENDQKEQKALVSFMQKNPKLVRDFLEGRFAADGRESDPLFQAIQSDLDTIDRATAYLRERKGEPGVEAALSILEQIKAYDRPVAIWAGLFIASRDLYGARGLAGIHHRLAQLVKIPGALWDQKGRVADLAIDSTPLVIARDYCQLATGQSCTFNNTRTLSRDERLRAGINTVMALGLGGLGELEAGARIMGGPKGLAETHEIFGELKQVGKVVDESGVRLLEPKEASRIIASAEQTARAELKSPALKVDIPNPAGKGTEYVQAEGSTILLSPKAIAEMARSSQEAFVSNMKGKGFSEKAAKVLFEYGKNESAAKASTLAKSFEGLPPKVIAKYSALIEESAEISIKRPFTITARQEMSREALDARQAVKGGLAPLHRVGDYGVTRANPARPDFMESPTEWALENPLTTPDFNDKYGIFSNGKDFIEQADRKPGANFVTRTAEPGKFVDGSGKVIETQGGGIEVIIEQGGVTNVKHVANPKE